MLEASEFVQIQNNTHSQAKEVVEKKNSKMEDVSKEPSQHFSFLAGPQKPPFLISQTSEFREMNCYRMLPDLLHENTAKHRQHE